MKTNSHINSQGKASNLRFNQIKKSNPLVGGDNRSNHRSDIVGVPPTDIPRRRLGNINHQRTCDNLLDFNTLKTYDYEII